MWLAMAFFSKASLRCNTKDSTTLLGDSKFRALDTLVEITASPRDIDMVDCLMGKFGPYKRGDTGKVPLWIALQWHQMKRCDISIPLWLTEDELMRRRDEERDEKERLLPVDEHYIEVACVFLHQTRVVTPQRKKEKILMLLRELVEIRRNKIIAGMSSINSKTKLLDVSDMSSLEIACFRMRCLAALEVYTGLHSLQKVARRVDVGGSTQGDDSMTDSGGVGGNSLGASA